MTSKNGSAEIYDMEDARARRGASGLPGDDYPHAGAHLAAVRETAGLTLADAAGRTHIKQNHLAAIEEMNTSELPPRPYAIGFVKTYAEFLGLDQNEIVERFKESADYQAPQKIEVEQFEAAEVAAENEPRDMSLKAFIAIMVFIIWCAWQITRPHEVKLIGADARNSVAGESVPNDGLPLSSTLKAEQIDLSTIVEASIIERIEPVYPRRCAGDAKAVETVVLAFNITAGGRVTGEQVAQSSNDCFDEAALIALRRWQFEPRLVDGAPRPAFDQKYSFSFNRPH